MDGNVESLAKQVEKGANSIEGVEAKLWQACVKGYKYFKVYLLS